MKHEPIDFMVPRDEQKRRILAQCIRRLRAIGEEELARQILVLPSVRELYAPREAAS